MVVAHNFELAPIRSLVINSPHTNYLYSISAHVNSLDQLSTGTNTTGSLLTCTGLLIVID